MPRTVKAFFIDLQILLCYHSQTAAITTTARTTKWFFVANNYVYLQFLSVKFPYGFTLLHYSQVCRCWWNSYVFRNIEYMEKGRPCLIRSTCISLWLGTFWEIIHSMVFLEESILKIVISPQYNRNYSSFLCVLNIREKVSAKLHFKWAILHQEFSTF